MIDSDKTAVELREREGKVGQIQQLLADNLGPQILISLGLYSSDLATDGEAGKRALAYAVVQGLQEQTPEEQMSSILALITAVAEIARARAIQEQR